MDRAWNVSCSADGYLVREISPYLIHMPHPPAALARWSSRVCVNSPFPLAGVLKFARLVKSYEAQDPEIASLSGKLKALFLPPMTLPPHGPASGGSVAAS
jgi:hypothetical protein